MQVLVVGADSNRRRMLADALRAAGAPVFETDDLRTAAESLAAGGLFGPTADEPNYRSVEVGLEP